MSPRTPLAVAVIALGACVPALPTAPAQQIEAGSDIARPPERDVGPTTPVSDVGGFDAQKAREPDARDARDASGADARDARDASGADAGDGGDAAPPRAPHPGEIALQEIMVDPDGNDLGHEWIEIANVTTEPLDLTALHVSDATTDVAIDGGFLLPGRLLVLGQSADPTHNGGVVVDRAYGTRLTLNNGADRVSICLGPCASGQVLDWFEWTAAPGAAYIGHAMVMVPGTRATCPATQPYGPAGDFGSPGQANPACPLEPRAPLEPLDAG
jgi:Lamin Tail Domain